MKFKGQLYHKILKPVLTVFMLSLLCFALQSDKVKAEVRQTEITYLEKQQDLLIMFTFEKNTIPITFISPSGVRYAAGDTGVDFADGDQWSTYRVINAEPGSWYVEYDREDDNTIEYSIINESLGIWIQYVNIGTVSDDRIPVTFRADYDGDYASYLMQLWAINLDDESLSQIIYESYFSANSDESIEAYLGELNSGNYVLKMDVSRQEGDVDIFDAMQCDTPFYYANPATPEKLSQCHMTLDISNQILDLDWSNNSFYDISEIKLIVAGKEEYFNDVVDLDYRGTSVIYSEDEKELVVRLFYKRGNLWSEPYEKKIIIPGSEYIKTDSDIITGKADFVMDYATTDDRVLAITLNGNKAEYAIKDKGQLSLTLIQGSNEIFAIFDGADDMTYKLDMDIYYDAYPPEIIILDNLNNKNIVESNLDIIGIVKDGEKLFINGADIPMEESGRFVYRVTLSEGENIVEVRASDISGNETLKMIKLYHGQKPGIVIENEKNPWLQYLPLATSLVTSLLIIFLSYLFMRKQPVKKAQKKKLLRRLIGLAVLLSAADAVFIIEYIRYYGFIYSLEYFDIAEKSITTAARYMRYMNGFFVATVATSALLILTIVAAVLVGVIKSRKKR